MGGRPKGSLHNIPYQIYHYEIFRLHRFVRNAARFDYHQSLLARNPARISECVQHQPPADQLEIGFQHRFAQVLQAHAFPRAAAAMWRKLGRMRPAATGALSFFPNPKYNSRYSPYSSSYTLTAFASGSTTRYLGQRACWACSIVGNAPAATAAKMAEPRLVTSDCGISTGLFNTLAYTRFSI